MNITFSTKVGAYILQFAMPDLLCLWPLVTSLEGLHNSILSCVIQTFKKYILLHVMNVVTKGLMRPYYWNQLWVFNYKTAGKIHATREKLQEITGNFILVGMCPPCYKSLTCFQSLPAILSTSIYLWAKLFWMWVIPRPPSVYYYSCHCKT